MGCDVPVWKHLLIAQSSYIRCIVFCPGIGSFAFKLLSDCSTGASVSFPLWSAVKPEGCAKVGVSAQRVEAAILTFV